MNCKCGSVRWDLIKAAVTWAGLCVRTCVFVCVRVCDEEKSRMLSMSIFEMDSTESNFVSVNCKCRSVSCDVFRAAVTWTGCRVSGCVILCGYMFVFVCDFAHRMMNDEDTYEVML